MLNRFDAMGAGERALASYLARALDDSPRARELCRELTGRTLRIEVVGLELAVLVHATGETLQVQRAAARTGADVGPDADATPDVTLRGTPLSLLAAAAGDAEQLVADGRLTLGGDEQLARRFQELARLLRPGLETGLTKFIGPMPSHLATRGLRALQQWGRAAGHSLLDNSADYLAHESRDLVPRAEAEQFLGGVEDLRRSVARAEARVAQLAERLARA